MNIRPEEILSELFNYDKDLPLDVAEHLHEEEADGPVQYHVTFASVHDQRVPALLTMPEGSGPFPVVLMLHGVMGHKYSPNQRKRAAFLAAFGYACFRIDGQYRGEREVALCEGVGIQTLYFYRNRDAMIQSAIDLRRAADYLSTRSDIDMQRLGFAGFSMGGAIGTLFCANEPRVKAVVLGITGGDFDKLRLRIGPKHLADQLRRAYSIVDPVLYIHQIAPRPLLMINGARDEVIPRAATEALFDAAREPKRIVWYDCGHADLPDAYMDEMKQFLDTKLGAGQS